MSMQILSQSNRIRLTAEEYVSLHLYLYEVQVPNLATVFLAINRQSVDDPENLIQPDNKHVTDPKQLLPVLNANSSYGGTRAEPPLEEDPRQSRLNALDSLVRLAFYESHVKHKYLTKTVERGALDELISSDGKIMLHLTAQNEAQVDIPKEYPFSQDFLRLSFQGGRAIILAHNLEIHKVIVNPNHPQSYDIYSAIFSDVGAFLNGQLGAFKVDVQGKIIEQDAFIPAGALFITPDFGPNKKLADYLHEHTPQVLGVDASVGGGGGKAAYTVSGFLGAFDAASEHGLFESNDRQLPITLIGAAGAMGSDTAKRLATRGFENVLVADIAYDYAQPVEIDQSTGEKLVPILESERYRTQGEPFQRIPGSWDIALAKPKQFTNEALSGLDCLTPRVIIAMTFGKALENSNFDAIPNYSTILLAENWSLPPGSKGMSIMRRLKQRRIVAIPGQVITPGGAGNSKVEIFFRATMNGGIPKATKLQEKPVYPKRLGHEIVYRQIKRGISDLLLLAQEQNITTMEAIAQYTGLPIVAQDFITQTFY